MLGFAKRHWKSTEPRTGNVPDLIGYQEIKCHIVFDVKMDFQRRARFVAGGHTTMAPSSMMQGVSQRWRHTAKRVRNELKLFSQQTNKSKKTLNYCVSRETRRDVDNQGGIERGKDHGKV
jgi:hypothetical protein